MTSQDQPKEVEPCRAHWGPQDGNYCVVQMTHAKSGCFFCLLTFTLLSELIGASLLCKQKTGPEKAYDFPKVIARMHGVSV